MIIELKPKWRFKDYPHIKITKDNVVYNSKTNRLKKRNLNGGSTGYWVTDRLFIVNKNINKNIEFEPKTVELPF